MSEPKPPPGKRGPHEDLTGQIFGRLTVLALAPLVVYGKRGRRKTWHCKCECGTEVYVQSYLLRTRSKRSCGCWGREASHLRRSIYTKALDSVDEKATVES